MPQPAFTGTYPHPGIPGATVTAGAEHLVPWLQRYCGRPVDLVADIETYGVDLDGYRIKCVVLGVDEAAFVADPRDLAQAVLIRRALGYARTVVGHKLNFDLPSLSVNGMIDAQVVDKAVDTLIYARVAEPGELVPKTLDACARRYLGVGSAHTIGDMFKTLGLTKTEGYQRLDIDSPAYLMGAAGDGITNARLLPAVYSAALDFTTTGHPFKTGLSRVEAAEEIEKHQIVNRWGIGRTIAGMRADLDYLERYRASTAGPRRADMAYLAEAGLLPKKGKDQVNANQLVQALDEHGVLPPDHPRTKTGAWSTTEKDLATLGHPVAQAFGRVKKLDKIVGYIDKCAQLSVIDGRIHPTTEVLKAAHGRSSMTGIEIHQFPALARPIVAFDESGTSVDWSAQEPMFAINDAGDVAALQGYELRGEKIYDGFSPETPYKKKKIVVLGTMYGEGLRKLSADMGLDFGPYVPKVRNGIVLRDGNGEPKLIPTYAAGKELVESAFSGIPRTREMLKSLKNVAKQYGMIITMNGRIVPIPMGKGFVDEDTGEVGPPSRQTHKGPNYRICGSAADMYTDVVVECYRRGLPVWFGMHDEFLVPSSVAHDVQKIMQTPSERFIRMAGRVPVIRTDLEPLGMNWKGEEK